MQKTTTFRLDDDLLGRLREFRKKTGIPMSEVLRRALTRYMDEYEKRTAATEAD